MATYMVLCKWTDLGRREVATLPDRVTEVTKGFEEVGGKVLGAYLSMGRYDQVVLIEAPDDEAAAKFAVVVAGRGFAETETLRCFSMNEMRGLI